MPTNPFGAGVRQWTRITEALRAASTTVLAKGELAVNDLGQVFGGNGTTQLKDRSPLVTAAEVSNTYLAKPTGGTTGQALLLQQDGSYSPGSVAVSKVDVGLGNVDNTADVNKPVSSPQQASLDAEVTRADGAYMRAPSILHLSPSEFWFALGTEEYGYFPDSSGNARRGRGVLLYDHASSVGASNNNEGARAEFKFPYGWNTVSVDILWSPITAAGGNAYWNGSLYNIADGGAFNAGSGLAATAGAAGTTAYRLKRTSIPTVVAADYTGHSVLHIYRNASSSSDTISGDILFLGVDIKKVS